MRSVGRALWSACGEGEPCWREGCADCLILQRALQDVGSALGDVAVLADQTVRPSARWAKLTRQARDGLLSAQELAREIAAPAARHAQLFEILDVALSAMRSVDEDASVASDMTADTDAQMAARLETVIATTLAEVDRAHDERAVDLARIAGDLLDAEIALHEAAVERLRAARDRLDSRSTSVDLADEAAAAPEMPESLRAARGSGSPLQQPSAWSADATSPSLIQRPLSVVGSLFGLRPW